MRETLSIFDEVHQNTTNSRHSLVFSVNPLSPVFHVSPANTQITAV
jgi:hypothetical protein